MILCRLLMSPYLSLSLHLPTFASVEVLSNLEAEAVDFEPDEDDFMDEDVRASDVSARAGHLRIRSVFCFVVIKTDQFC